MSNFPIEIATYSIDSDTLKRNTKADDIAVKLKHKMPDEFLMDDLSPGSYAKLSDDIKAIESKAIEFRG